MDVTATTATTTFSIFMQEAWGYYVLDDVSVTAAVTPGIETAAGATQDIEAPMTAGIWLHVAASLDDATGAMRLYIDGNQVAGFSDVVGLEAHTETDDYREGGINDYVHKIAKETKFPNLTLKRGLTDATGLWDWYKDVIAGDIRRKTVSLVLLDSQRHEKWRWIFSEWRRLQRAECPRRLLSRLGGA